MMRAPCYQHDAYDSNCSSCREMNGLAQVADVVLGYRPKSKQPKPWKRKKAKRVNSNAK